MRSHKSVKYGFEYLVAVFGLAKRVRHSANPVTAFAMLGKRGDYLYSYILVMLRNHRTAVRTAILAYE